MRVDIRVLRGLFVQTISGGMCWNLCCARYNSRTTEEQRVEVDFFWKFDQLESWACLNIVGINNPTETHGEL